MSYAHVLKLSSGSTLGPHVRELVRSTATTVTRVLDDAFAVQMGTDLREDFEAALRDLVKELDLVQEPWLETLQKHLWRFQQLEAGWDTYDAPAPGASSVAIASDFLNCLWRSDPSFSPSRIAPSVDGGVVVAFLTDTKRANVEFFDTGEIVAMTSSGNGRPPEVWELENDQTAFLEGIEQIRNVLEGRPPATNV